MPRFFVVLLTCLILVLCACRAESTPNQRQDPCAAALAIQSDSQLVVVLFSATWSGPDLLLIPLLEAAVKERPSVILRRVDVDKDAAIAQACNITSVPTVQALRHGRVSSGFVGAVPREHVARFLDSLINHPSPR